MCCTTSIKICQNLHSLLHIKPYNEISGLGKPTIQCCKRPTFHQRYVKVVFIKETNFPKANVIENRHTVNLLLKEIFIR